ncbi:acyltransferase family protein [Neiella marina]|uniref:Acyltransferase family protein n=2 Tax=Neiella holothuriorum TaxID=2870530 RepID=A0ABS7EIJ1_9GAMM|nr:acyltransferase family protein [Neiella holothuriorum]
MVRACACLSITLLHCMLFLRDTVPVTMLDIYDIFRVLLCFATPAFVMLSETLIARSYHQSLPDAFLGKRLKFIVAPFIAFAIVSELVKVFVVGEAFDPMRLGSYLLGKYHGWFVIVIVQFYLMHMAIVKFKLSQLSIILLTSFITYFHYKYVTPHIDHRDYKFIFTTWAAFFCFGYFIGRYYQQVIAFIKQNTGLIYGLAILSIAISTANFIYDGKLVHSKLFENIPLTISLFGVLLLVGLKFGDRWWVQTVSRSSYGIYLVHWPVIVIYTTYLPMESLNYWLSIPLLFIMTTITSIVIVRSFNNIPLGHYIVGKDNYRGPKKAVAK